MQHPACLLRRSSYIHVNRVNESSVNYTVTDEQLSLSKGFGTQPETENPGKNTDICSK